MTLRSLKNVTIPGILAFTLLSIMLPTTGCAQGVIQETIARRDLVIDLDDGLTTDAQLTFPVVGNGPFPGVLLIHGSGSTDMNHYIPSVVTGTGEPSQPFLQIAEYLSNRGFAVLRYNKRGVGLNDTILDFDTATNNTVHDLIADAEQALQLLMQQREVDTNAITILGWSEGTAIAPRIALKNSSVTKIVLWGAYAQNLSEVTYFQFVDRTILYAEEVDHNGDGLLSIPEISTTLDVDLVDLSPLPPNALIENSTGEWQWYPGLDTNTDGYFSIQEELKPLRIQAFEWFTTAESYWLKWLQSHFTLDTNLAVIGNVSASILILQGEGETQAPVEQAFLLEQRLTETNHPDHTLITYPGLGHSLYPVNGWIQPLGPIQEHVLSDLVTWLKDPTRTVRTLTTQITHLEEELNRTTNELESAKTTINDLANQISDFQSNASNLQNTIVELEKMLTDLEKSTNELQSELVFLTNLTYLTIVIFVAAVMIIAYRKR